MAGIDRPSPKREHSGVEDQMRTPGEEMRTVSSSKPYATIGPVEETATQFLIYPLGAQKYIFIYI